MYAIDTNILVYAHNTGAAHHERAKAFIEGVMSETDENGKYQVCIPSQVLIEFLNVITWSRLESPLSLNQATEIVKDYFHSGADIIHPSPNQLNTLFELLESVKSRKKVFDVALVATLKDNGIQGLYTVNTTDFAEFSFLDVRNPLL